MFPFILPIEWNPHRVTLNDIFKISVLYLESALWEPETQIMGVVVIFDMNGISLETALELTPEFGELLVDWLQNCIPLRIRGIHLVNEPFYVNAATNPLHTFNREESRYHCHGNNRASLHQFISTECLPASYGGKCTEPRLSGDQWYRFFMQTEKEFETLNSYGYNK